MRLKVYSGGYGGGRLKQGTERERQRETDRETDRQRETERSGERDRKWGSSEVGREAEAKLLL